MIKDSSLPNILANFGQIWLHKEIAKQIRLAFLLIILQLGIILFFFSRLPPQIPLFFSNPWGESQLASPIAFFLLPLLSFVIFLANTFLIALLISKDEFLVKMLSFGSTIFSFFALVAILKIVSLAL